jgi:AcrB/AcrD/AcrF family
MTSLAFILGVLPLAVSNGAGSGSQHAIGTGVIGGMLSATFLAIFMIPMFFVVIRNKFSRGKGAAGGGTTQPATSPALPRDPDATNREGH